MRVIVLGSAAGGGVPQWNCGCENCRAAREGTDVQPRTQDCVAVTADDRRWFLLNASPDIARQLERTPALWPSARRHSPIAGIVLTNGDLDHCLGLLSLREWTPWSLYATAPTLAGLFERNVMLRTLDRQRPHAIRRPLALDRSEPLRDADGDDIGLTIRAFASPGKLPLHLESMVEASPAINVGLEITQPQTGARLLHVPAAATLDGLVTQLDHADCLLFDGSFWSDDELQRVQVSSRSARAMAHLPVGGPDGSLEQLSRLATRRIIYTHINNTNPMLR
ncbi:MAG TPA: pyrroloquinoline quinone biosynthesis protein PqqB, partial [Enhygromyxa sp.]|nr:pyrroloquinoline quinone biosynthesis protein PqqB [Enhygromyxa sp.]